MIEKPSRVGKATKKGTGLTELPVEILQSICGHLCLHCQTPHAVDVPYSLVHTALLNQRALSSLSRTCGHLRAVAQPVLFHLYLSDSSYCVPGEIPDDDGDERIFRADLFNVCHHFHERHRAALFLRTLLERGDLAACVCALTLHQAPWNPSVQLDRRGDIEVSRLRQLGNGLVAEVVTQGTQRVLVGSVDGHLAKTRGNMNDTLERVQELIVVLSASSLEQLCIERTMFLDELVNMPYDWRSWSYHLPRLEYLAFLGQRVPGANTYYYKEAHGLVSSAPNLRKLVLPDCHAHPERWMAHQFRNVPWDVSLKFLVKLSVSGIRRNHLRTILAGCPVLEDLEYFCQDTGFDDDILCPEEDLSVVRGTLRRLCYSIHPANINSGSEPELDILDEDYYPSWAAMTALKILEIQRVLLYGTSQDNLGDEADQGQSHDEQDQTETDFSSGQMTHPDSNGGTPEDDVGENNQQPLPAQRSQETLKMNMTAPEDFMSRLPQTLETLRIGRIVSWPAMYRDAVALAKAAPDRFPYLRRLYLEMHNVCPPQDEIAALVGIFTKTNITCLVRPGVDRKIGRSSHGFSLDSSVQINLLMSADDLGAQM
ncbi:hypothetical protein FAVG1_09006 [Fusarium avenaceum]|nr:hypothetical protein FAVG1_09006 [Fusarium avenaceum]